FLLFGIGILYGNYGLLNIAAVAASVPAPIPYLDATALALLIAALLMKAGSFPVHMWKPDVFQEAPANVTAMLLASSLVALYLVMRICFLFFGMAGLNSVFGWIVAILGCASIFLGISMALLQKNLKRLLGYVAVAEIGYVMLGAGAALIAMPNMNGFAMDALLGSIFHTLNEGLEMGLLFLLLGSIIYSTGKNDLGEVQGLAHKSPALAMFFLAAALAVSGMPPFGSFSSKLLIYESVYLLNPLLTVIALAGSIMLLAALTRIFSTIFLGIPYKGEARPVPKSMLAAMAAILLAIILFGLFPQLAIENLVKPAASVLADPSAYLEAIL
ncbi:MAG: NADH:ubiquinone oxidoreductase, partial [Candidatus Diapherotrites archaeon]|nr:NADH:ubiquinone oxidoreductase [Candidatus Diapherotrites archaeon]